MPRDERCNAADDDCDGRVDEALRRPCPDQAGVCRGTTAACDNGLFAPCDYADLIGDGWRDDELGLCDGLDNDCDGAADEDCDCTPAESRECGGPPVGRCQPGRQLCDARGQWGACQEAIGPIDETCNGIDDDCDGDTDEGQTGAECDTGRPGVCTDGVTDCVDGARVCQQRIERTDEACNGADDDCDGATDEEVDGGRCPLGALGICADGREVCVDGRIECRAADAARDELCNGLDDDCDGAVDEGLDGAACGAGDPICPPGVFECVQGVGRCLRPDEGLRDGLDEDCDGTIDEFPPLLDRFDLADAAVAGMGVRPGVPPQSAFEHPGDLVDGAFLLQPDNPFVHAIFVPLPDDPSVLDATGTTYQTAFDVGDGRFWRPHAKGPGISIRRPAVTDYGDRATTSLLEMHANYGITFDLGEIAAYTGRPTVRLTGVAGISIDFERWGWVAIVDGQVRGRDIHNRRREDPFDIDLRGARFLTFIAGDGDRDNGFIHTYFGNPQIQLGAPSR